MFLQQQLMIISIIDLYVDYFNWLFKNEMSENS